MSISMAKKVGMVNSFKSRIRVLFSMALDNNYTETSILEKKNDIMRSIPDWATREIWPNIASMGGQYYKHSMKPFYLHEED